MGIISRHGTMLLTPRSDSFASRHWVNLHRGGFTDLGCGAKPAIQQSAFTLCAVSVGLCFKLTGSGEILQDLDRRYLHCFSNSGGDSMMGRLTLLLH